MTQELQSVSGVKLVALVRTLIEHAPSRRTLKAVADRLLGAHPSRTFWNAASTEDVQALRTWLTSALHVRSRRVLAPLVLLTSGAVALTTCLVLGMSAPSVTLAIVMAMLTFWVMVEKLPRMLGRLADELFGCGAAARLESALEPAQSGERDAVFSAIREPVGAFDVSEAMDRRAALLYLTQTRERRELVREDLRVALTIAGLR